MKVSEVISYFEDFYDNFDSEKTKQLLKDLDLDIDQKLTKMSKGNFDKKYKQCCKKQLKDSLYVELAYFNNNCFRNIW